jgi:hypothetical protein
MNDLVNRILSAYRPLYLRGLLMDGQYRLPVQQQAPPPKGKKPIRLTPVFQPARRRALIATATAAAGMVLSANEDGAAKTTNATNVRARK